jgi:predicted Ser/Thr protein kinase
VSTRHPNLFTPEIGGRTSRLAPGVHMPTGTTRMTSPPVQQLDPIALEPGHEIGRFIVLSYLGAGATGIVYAAYDPELDRKVALKVLRPQGQSSRNDRVHLHDEAQAMAKVSHPNVVVVHEVGLHDDGIFIAMEFIRGATLGAWLKEQPRTWEEILGVFVQAGQGLAAAHAAGLVHRDFKPSNVIVGADGRVRVLDFGLSCTPTRARREVVGTPAYMSPEQFLGETIGPAADQFSFCASLYQALFGQLPFPGESTDELRLTVTSGQVRAPPRHVRVPSWLTAAVLRGLRHDPKDRFESMEALLRQLAPERARGRRTLLTAVAAAALLGLGGGYLGARAEATDPCGDALEQIDRIWHAEAQADIQRVFSGLPPVYAATTWPRVRLALDRWSDAWKANFRGAFEARQRGVMTEMSATHSAVCFERARAAFASAVMVLREADADVALHALEVANSLPDPAECSSSASLVAHTGASRDVHGAWRRELFKSRLEAVKVHARAGQAADAIALVEDVIREAQAAGDWPILADALLERARIDLERDPVSAEPYLTRAYLTAVTAGADFRAAEALALRVYVRGRTPGNLARAFDDLDLARAMLPRLGSPTSLRALLSNNAGTLYLAAGDAERSEALLQESLLLRKSTDGEDALEVGKTLGNLALLSRDPARRQERLREALRIFETNLGPAHPDTMGLRILAGALARDPLDAMHLVERGCDALDAYRPDDLHERADCLQHLAVHAREAGERELADAAILRARALVDQQARAERGQADRVADALIRGYAGLVDGDHANALAELERALAKPRGDEWWQRRKAAELQLCIGLHRLAVGDVPAARRALEASAATFAEIADKAHDQLLPRDLAQARLALARALIADRDLERAEQVLTAAESWYRDAGPAFAARLAEIAALRRTPK